MQKEQSYDIFIAYHGTDDAFGSMQKAKEIYYFLVKNFDGINVYLNPISNPSGGFDITPEVACSSKLFLLVANSHLDRAKLTATYGKYLYAEVMAFYNSVRQNPNGRARVYAFDGLTAESAGDLHPMFGGSAHFQDNKNNVAKERLLEWVKSSLNFSQKVESEVVATKVFDAKIQAHNFSSRFLHKGANAIKDKSLEEIKQKIDQLSLVYKDVTTIKKQEQVQSFESVADSLLGIFSNVEQSANKRLAKIKGPLGSYKNRLLQYLYLYLQKSQQNVLPFYVDLAMYERDALLSQGNALSTRVKMDFEEISAISEKAKEIPLIIVDSVRNFSSGKNHLYPIVNSFLEKLNCKYVISLDTDFTVNPRQLINPHPLATTNFDYFVRIRSLKLYNKQASMDFLQNCIKAFDIQIASGLQIEQIYNQFFKANLLSLDAYWTAQLLQKWQNYLGNEDSDIGTMYYALAMDAVGHRVSELDYASKLAFEYEYGSLEFTDSDFFFDPKWQLIRKHRSVLDYLIARHYVKEFETTLEEVANGNKNNLKFFDMVLPKSVTRFVTKMISQISGYENKILQLAKSSYDELPGFCKSEMTFWLGRMKSHGCKEESVQLLKEIVEKEKKNYFATQNGNLTEKRMSAFLLRGAYVSAIYREDKRYLKEYIESLLWDDVANGVNRGFHLEYYGDKLYVPGNDQLNFVDDLTKGEATLRFICLSLSKRMEQYYSFNIVAILELFTLCSLIQARIESSDPKTLDVKPYVEPAKEYVEWVLQQGEIYDYPQVREYFVWMQKELQEIDTFVPSRLYDKYSQAVQVDRTGWTMRGIQQGENIVEHMYSCWLLAMLHLPETIDQQGYDKQTILNMLLIHDLGERDTGDIPREEKLKDLDYYNRKEYRVMKDLWYNSTYPQMGNFYLYDDCWEKWYKQDNVNARIAKDIDEIQAIYQFCLYYLQYPENFALDDARRWLRGLNSVKTPITREIATKLITNNPKFKEVFEKLS
ncbi:MAG: HD domain-containing protein [Clostridia bacterium]|nr:HD domain-containing protein [Clostridia bacterium]